MKRIAIDVIKESKLKESPFLPTNAMNQLFETSQNQGGNERDDHSQIRFDP
jgi:hypothetical protein